MPALKQFRSKQASLWQSAVDRAVSTGAAASSPAAGLEDTAPAAPVRPPQDDPAVLAGNEIAASLDAGVMPEAPPPPSAAAGFQETVAFCSKTALRIAEARVQSIFSGNTQQLKALQEEIGAKFGGCDPQWVEVIAEYVKNRVGSIHIPYRVHNTLDDFVIADERFPDNARIAIVGDWGTGEDGARRLLSQIAAKNPDVVIHLGDVYYSGTQHEFQNYFYPIWRDVLGLPDVPWGGKLAGHSKPATFTLSGNHDMYAGGAPYYTVLDMIGQPASYFCLRNTDWQFIALDTGKNDANPTAAGKNVTFIEDTEVDWLKHQVAGAGTRKTVLLSHHQLYTAFENEKIGDGFVNDKLLANTGDILPQVTAWFWGHEHNLVIFDNPPHVLGRCAGHGAFPVGVDELGKLGGGFAIKNVKLALDPTGGLFQHGYIMMELTGNRAVVRYFQFDSASGAELEIFTENL